EVGRAQLASLFVDLLQKCSSAVQGIDADVSRKRRQPGFASGYYLVVVSVLVIHNGVASVLRADGEYRVILCAEIAAIRTRPPKSLAVAGHSGQDDIVR